MLLSGRAIERQKVKAGSRNFPVSTHKYSKVSIISTGRSRLLEFEIEIVLVV